MKLLLLGLLGFVSASICKDPVLSALSQTYSSDLVKQLPANLLFNIENSGKGPNELGKYRTCKRNPESEYYIIKTTLSGFQVAVGLCVPKTCDEAEILVALNSINKSLHFNIEKPETFSLGLGGSLLVFFLILFTILGVLGSVFTSEKSKGIYSIVHCFSLKSNYNGLMSIRKSKPGEHLSVLDGVRVFALVTIVMAHTMTFKFRSQMYNAEEVIPKVMSSWWALLVNIGSLSVDTFFWLGGFLLGYLLLTEVEKKRGKFGFLGWCLVYIHRILRLLPVYIFFLYFYISVYPSLGSGPQWSNKSIILKDCEEYWWTVPLFLNNIVPDGLGNQCLGIGYYLANDFQFFLFGPLLILMYYFAAKWVSWVVYIVLTIICFVVSFQISQENGFRLHITAIQNLERPGNLDYYHLYYTKPYTRYAPYITGLFCGFVYVRYCKKFVTKEEDTNKDPVCSALIKYWRHPTYCWVFLSLGLFFCYYMLAVQYPIYDNLLDDNIWAPTTHYIMIPLHRIIFILSFSCFVMPMLMGRCSFFARFLSANFFSPLAKICFCCFLVEFGEILINLGELETSTFVSGLLYFRESSANTFLSFLLSFPVYLLIEAPFVNLEKLLCAKILGKSN